jgi:predicted Rossmann fold nucleotide-binding protein DprA/Smf involved in DNA uptake
VAKRKLEPHELRQLVEEERENILADLARIAEEDEAAREKEAKRQARFRKQAGRLLLRGKGLIPVVEMASALGWTRQLTHRAIREAEMRHKDANVS